ADVDVVDGIVGFEVIGATVKQVDTELTHKFADCACGGAVESELQNVTGSIAKEILLNCK
ncbi:MAG: hypothetical protein J6U99_01845, partial [Rikenellaceae bacterium]|nr:hypothetical protein [Rikenellaceae bacterium]